ncbi:hypothetical protein EV421DRAFT_1799247 [Armillaria borealis]|uniref:Uncharacterized protein n=1 Tax=Armillaria borealis TaxID=47425 RepID=A0AA39MSL3_9AGAR|nr:hypothetical protein EV421DRAFT_1799247 [Armillaria borealis]
MLGVKRCISIADEWDRTPSEPARSLSYQAMLELKAIQCNELTTTVTCISGIYTAAIRGTNFVFFLVKPSYKQSKKECFSAITRNSALTFTSHTNTDHQHQTCAVFPCTVLESQQSIVGPEDL